MSNDTISVADMLQGATAADLIHVLDLRLPCLYGEMLREFETPGVIGQDLVEQQQESIRRLVAHLMRTHAKLGLLRDHRHVWDENYRCAGCGMKSKG